jgi:hypothetical protein
MVEMVKQDLLGMVVVAEVLVVLVKHLYQQEEEMEVLGNYLLLVV